MGKKQKNIEKNVEKNTEKKVRMNKRLVNAKMDEKFKMSFSAINIGFIVVALIAISNVALYASMSEVNILTSHRGIIAIILLILAVGWNISLSLTVSKSLSNSLVIPIRELQAAVQKLRAGDFDIEITYESPDELGELGADLRETCAEMQTIIADASYLLGEMAEGRFNVSSKVEDNYVGDFRTLLSSINKLNSEMDSTLRQIKEASELVMVGSEQLASSAQDLAEGATNQASSIVELTSTIENVTKISEESAKNAVTAATNAKATAEDAGKSHEEIKQLTEAMERITQTSQEIEDIIGAIEDIASQTNLLSLNASIEAARAGEAGRGFAVVADQIGKLAADSAQSAITTRELISKCLEEIETGNSIVEHTMESIGTVLANMETFAGMASGAAEASKMQADMLKQVEEGIDQISSVVQNNSATAEETSAVSQELSTQSVSLEDMVAKFVLSDE